MRLGEAMLVPLTLPTTAMAPWLLLTLPSLALAVAKYSVWEEFPLAISDWEKASKTTLGPLSFPRCSLECRQRLLDDGSCVGLRWGRERGVATLVTILRYDMETEVCTLVTNLDHIKFDLDNAASTAFSKGGWSQGSEKIKLSGKIFFKIIIVHESV